MKIKVGAPLAASFVALMATSWAGEDQKYDLTLYGLGHLSLDQADNVPDDAARLASNSSRIGARGKFRLNDAIAVIAQFEQGIDLTNAGSNDGNGPGDTSDVFTRARDSYIGITGAFGTLKYGRQGLLNQWLYDVNYFADQVGDLGNIWGGTGYAGRGDNTVSYETPDFNGFSGIVLYTASPSDTADDEIFAFKGQYKNNGWSLAAAWSEATPMVSSLEEHTVAALTAQFRFPKTTMNGIDISGSVIGAGFQSESDIGGVSGNDRDSFTLGGALNVDGRHTFKAQYTMSDSEYSDGDANQFALGYDFALTDYLTLYAAYAETRNDDLAAFTANNYGHGKAQGPDSLGADPAVFSIGAVFSFECSCSDWGK
ncbi:porin [Parvularcula marina]|uniref:Porin n=1 Tax=Parvularcula marina TaxID=2292771 RepID=A0A371RGK5_9PROT|nr:porin [Parvularcula marina]RFB04593.1 porin [Parvularcula marina]